MSNDDNGTTTSISTRWDYTNDLLAGAVVLGPLLWTSYLLVMGQEVPLWLATVDSLSAITAVAWAFGKSALSSATKAYVEGRKNMEDK